MNVQIPKFAITHNDLVLMGSPTGLGLFIIDRCQLCQTDVSYSAILTEVDWSEVRKLLRILTVCSADEIYFRLSERDLHNEGECWEFRVREDAIVIYDEADVVITTIPQADYLKIWHSLNLLLDLYDSPAV